MRTISVFFCLLVLGTFVHSQSDLQSMVDADRALSAMAAEKDMKSAYVAHLADDGVMFRPNAVNGKDFWRLKEDSAARIMTRTMTHADIAANGLFGYTTGTWEEKPRDPKGAPRKVGQYVTIWTKKPDGRFLMSVDITTEYDEATPPIDNPVLPTNILGDLNKRRWSAADPSMNFLRAGMGRGGLGSAFDDFAAEDIRLLLEENPPILGKRNSVKAMKRYKSVAFPKKVSLMESSDMAYAWNPCEYANSDEGMEKGNCLNVWKLRKKKWYIVLAVFARVTNEVKPTLKMRAKSEQ